MNKRIFHNIESNIAVINSLSKEIKGFINVDNRKVDAVMVKNEDYKMKINTLLDLDIETHHLAFSNNDIELEMKIFVTSQGNSINIPEKWSSQHSEGTVYSFRSKDFIAKNTSIYRAFYKINSSNFLMTCFEEVSYMTETFSSRGLLNLTINNDTFPVFTYHNDYLIIESDERISFEDFSEYCYNILIAIGFVTGKFFQSEVFIFDIDNDMMDKFCYRRLRNSSFSIYHAVTNNPYGYKDFIGAQHANDLYKNNTLKAITSQNLSCLVKLIHNNSQIQYALVLFNEANSGDLSLLVKNNCFYVVLEVLKKFFHTIYKEKLPKDYSSRGNTDKYVTLFNCITTLSDKDEQLLKDRNLYLHGDIKDLEGQKMVDDMQKQIILIYRLMLTHVGFEGYIINHYAIRNNDPDNAFVKCN